MLSVRGISRTLGALAIKDISFEVRQGEYFVLLGASGVGKSVLLETIAGIIRPDTGRVFLDGKDITNEQIHRRKIGFVFQNSTLFPHMTVYDNIAFGLRCRRLQNRQIHKRVGELAEDFAVSHLLKCRPQTLSGGEAQRVCLARAVASEPKCLLLDEPISSLDVSARGQIRALLRKISSGAAHLRNRANAEPARGPAIVHVTHDYTEAVCLGTHIAVMENGRIVQAGAAQEVFHRPKSEFVARFVGIRNFFKGRLPEPDYGQARAREFVSNGLSFSVLTDRPGGSGYIMVRSRDVTICDLGPKDAAGQPAPAGPAQNGRAFRRPRTSARNNFEGTIVDIIPNGNLPGGVEVIVDIGAGKPVEVAALITAQSAKMLDLHPGKRVSLSFKASAVEYVEEGDGHLAISPWAQGRKMPTQ